MNEPRQFHIGDLISITDGHLLSPQGLRGVKELLEYMSGEENLLPMAWPRVADEVEPYLTKQFPVIAALRVPATICGCGSRKDTKCEDWPGYPSEKEAKVARQRALYEWGERMAAEHGEWHTVQPLPPGVHQRLSPIEELLAGLSGTALVDVTARVMRAIEEHSCPECEKGEHDG